MTVDSPLRKMCGIENKAICQTVSECKILAQKDYKKRDDNVCR